MTVIPCRLSSPPFYSPLCSILSSLNNSETGAGLPDAHPHSLQEPGDHLQGLGIGFNATTLQASRTSCRLWLRHDPGGVSSLSDGNSPGQGIVFTDAPSFGVCGGPRFWPIVEPQPRSREIQGGGGLICLRGGDYLAWVPFERLDAEHATSGYGDRPGWGHHTSQTGSQAALPLCDHPVACRGFSILKRVLSTPHKYILISMDPTMFIQLGRTDAAQCSLHHPLVLHSTPAHPR